MDYQDFIASKTPTINRSGFEAQAINDRLFPFQREIVMRACRAGKYAIFADCGLGKTLMQLEWAAQVARHSAGKVLILCPLAVAGQTIREGAKFGIPVSRWDAGDESIHIANYEQLENIDTSQYRGVVLDESSILKNFDGKTRGAIVRTFDGTPYKLACTATPSPNDLMELGQHAEFLEIVKSRQMLAMYFVNDGARTGNWRLKRHAAADFYRWVGLWATMLGRPSDLGFDDTGYDLPPIEYQEHRLEASRRSDGVLLNPIVNATNFNAELRATLEVRMQKAAELVEQTKGPVIVWVKQNAEADYLAKLLPDAVEVRGNYKPEVKEDRMLGFCNGDFRVLITKAKIAQFGLNFQHCPTQIFAALDFSFEGLYQAVRRSHRFGQKNPVKIHIISTDSMANVVEVVKRKQQQFEELREAMTSTINEASQDRPAHIYDVEPIATDRYSIARGDCVDLIKSVPDESIGLSVFSPPFASLYTYSDNPADMGNCSGWEEFQEHFKYLVKELYRVTWQGRNVCVHCMDLPINKSKEGFIGLRDFSGIILRAFEEAGFIYHSRVTIWKNPVKEMQRTKALGLLHKQVKKDCTMSRVGMPDYVLIFRKDGDREHPVSNDWMPVEQWQKWASPVWMDIDYGNTLQYTTARDGRDEKHICPLQLGTIERLIALYSNEGDRVLTPFMGIGSEVYQAVKMRRFGVGFELKDSYYAVARQNALAASEESGQLSLLDMAS